MNRAACFSLVIALAVAGFASGDCGSIPFKPWVSIYEPNQRAVIAFNGREQMLILSTDLRASEPTKVLEVIPLPSEPDVKKGDVAVFTKAVDLINRKLFPNRGAVGGMGRFGALSAAGREPLPPAGEVTERKTIGAHSISVTHVLDGQRFVQWAEGYLAERGVDQPKIPTPLKSVIRDYIRDGFVWFAFDVVDLGKETVTKDAIQYRFKTDALYYPLRITRAEKGDTNVRLIVLTPGLVQMPTGPDLRVQLVHRPVHITRDELKELNNADLDRMLRRRGNLQLRIWEINGQLSGFRRDIITR